SGQAKVPKSQYQEKGTFPIIDQGQNYLAGYTNDTNALYSGKLPVIIFGDHTRVFKYFDHPFCLGADGSKVLLPKSSFIPKYLYYYFLNAKIPNLGYSRHSKVLREISVPRPLLSEQRRIVEILDQADVLREKRTEADKNAEKILPVLFNKIFGEPSRNEKNWKKGTLKDAGASVRYGLGQPPPVKEKGVRLIRATNIHNGCIFEEDMIYIDPEEVPKSRNAFLSAREVLVVRSGAYTGDVAQVTEEYEGSVAGYDLVVDPGENLIGEFLESYLLTPQIQQNYFTNNKSRAGQPHLNSTQLEDTPLFVPDFELQRKYAGSVCIIRDLRKKRNECKIKIDNLFSVIINRAFSGDLTAKWRESHMKELLQEMEEQAKELKIK
ncbi:MAG: restriction endonuclease subunit S, partial [Bacteroidota bacterium]